MSCFSRQSCHDGGGGGGGGNQRPDPIRRAQGVGSDTITLRVRKGPSPTAAPVTTAPTRRRGRSSAPIDRARCEAAGLRPFRSDWTADRRRDVRHVDRSGIRWRRRQRNRDRYRLGTWPGIRPRIRRWNWRWRLPPWRGSIRAAPDQRGHAGVHERGAQKQNSRHGCAGSHRRRRRMRFAHPYRQISGPRRPR